MLNNQKLEAMKKALKGFKECSEKARDAFAKEHADANMDALVARAGIEWLEGVLHQRIVGAKKRSKAQEILTDKKFMKSVVAKFSEAEDEPFENFYDIVGYVEEMSDEVMNEKYREIGRFLSAHESLIPFKNGVMVLPPEEAMARVDACKEVEEYYDTFSQLCADEFADAPNEAKCVYCRKANEFNAKATFAFCLQKALLTIYTPVSVDGKDYFAWTRPEEKQA